MYTYDGMKTQCAMELNQAIDIGIKQLNKKQYVEGERSRENIKRAINTLHKSK